MCVRNVMLVRLGRLQLLGQGKSDYSVLEGATTQSDSWIYLFLLVFFSIGSTVVDFIISLLVNNLIVLSRISQSSIVGGIVNGLASLRSQVNNCHNRCLPLLIQNTAEQFQALSFLDGVIDILALGLDRSSHDLGIYCPLKIIASYFFISIMGDRRLLEQCLKRLCSNSSNGR